MASTTNDPFAHGGFSLTDPDAQLDLGECPTPEPIAQSYMTKPEQWENYTDPFLYEFEKKLLDYLHTMSQSRAWCTHQYMRKYTMDMMMMVLLGRHYNSKTDRIYVTRMKHILAYYSTRIQTSYYNREKHKTINKTCYVISARRFKNILPYSLKLRLEVLAEQGKLPNSSNMSLHKVPELKPGHARNPRTNANMEKRSEQKRNMQREYQRKRRAAAAEDGEHLG